MVDLRVLSIKRVQELQELILETVVATTVLLEEVSVVLLMAVFQEQAVQAEQMVIQLVVLDLVAVAAVAAARSLDLLLVALAVQVKYIIDL